MLGEEFAGLQAIFGPVSMAIYGVQIAIALDDPREALRRAEHIDVDRLPPTLLERRSVLLIDIARSHRATSNHVAAAGALLDAERVAPQEVRYNPIAQDLASALVTRARGRDPDLQALAKRLEALT
jgi:hypothetical protein